MQFYLQEVDKVSHLEDVGFLGLGSLCVKVEWNLKVASAFLLCARYFLLISTVNTGIR